MTNILHTAKERNVYMRNDRNVMVNFKPGEYMRKMYILTLRLFETLVVCHICKSTIVEFD